MWRNFRFLHTADVEKYEISPHVAMWHVCDVKTSTHMQTLSYFDIKSAFFAIYAVLSRNCPVVIYALLCEEKFIQKLR